jgi:hypothetical protein
MPRAYARRWDGERILEDVSHFVKQQTLHRSVIVPAMNPSHMPSGEYLPLK